MDKNSIIQAVKQQEEEKVGFSLKLPAGLKDELQKIASDESISMNALIVATLQSLVNDECGKSLKTAKKLILDYRTSSVNAFNNLEHNNGLYNDEDEARYAMELQDRINKIDEFLGA
jgi:hypothetical protein